ncbi:MAG: hypothetical protein WD648_00375 [Planctomycetaceae bacterium]
MADQNIKVLLCGDFGDSEMQSAVAVLVAANKRFELRRADGLAEPAGFADDDRWSPDLILIAQRRPGEYRPADIRMLQQAFPLARSVCCLGAWCESEGRNSDDWPAAVRVSARSAAARIRRELAVLAGQRPPLPLTAARDEIFAFDSPGDWPVRDCSTRVGVISPDRALRESLEDLLKSAGYSIVRTGESVEARAVVWDVDPWETPLADEIREFCNRSPDVAVIGLMSLGHPQCVSELLECGVRVIVAKLASADVLLDALEAAIAQTASGKRQLAGSLDSPCSFDREPAG